MFSIVLLGSCKKYEDNNGISLKTATGRLTGLWKVERSNGMDYDSLWLANSNTHIYHTINITRSGSFEERIVFSDGIPGSGNVAGDTTNIQWRWGQNKDTLILYDEFSVDFSFPITKLTNSEFTYQIFTFSGDLISRECIKL